MKTIYVMEVSNGWLVTLSSDNKKVAQNKTEVLKFVSEYMGDDPFNMEGNELPF